MIDTVTSLEECRGLWDAFSPRERPWDEWDIMFAYHDERHHEPRFLVHEPAGRPDGLIPLVRDTRDNSHELFGGCYADNRRLWVAIEDFPEFFGHLPEPTAFFDLNGAQVAEILAAHPQYEANFTEQDQRYFLVPADFGYDFNNHIRNFSSEKRKGFLYDLRKVRERNPEMRWSDDDESELFVKLVNERFGAESDYVTPEGQAEVRRVVRALREGGWLRTVTLSLDGVRQAVGMSVVYADTLTALYSTSNKDIKNLGKLLNVEIIQEGCRLRVNEVNYMTGMSWKAAWDMSSETCRTLRKPARTPGAEGAPAA